MSTNERNIDNEEKIIKENTELLDQYKNALSFDDYQKLRWLILRGRIHEFQNELLGFIFKTEPSEEEIKSSDKDYKNKYLKYYYDTNESLSNQNSKTNHRIIELEELNNQLLTTNAELQKDIAEAKKLIETGAKEITKLVNSNTELQSLVQQKRIDEKIPGYVNSVKTELSSDDNHFILMSKVWAGCGGFFGIAAVLASLLSLTVTINFDELKGFELFYSFTRGLLGISILSWLSFICLSNSKKYTHESIRRKDRRHALMFGQVFLQIYGSTATKEDAVLVFKDWNMSGDSAFSDHTDQPPGITTFFETAKEKLKSSLADK